MTPHLEFTIEGTPVSHQTALRANLQAWKARLRLRASSLWNFLPLTGKLKFTLIHFHEGNLAPLDDDNMVKPIRDALNKLVYDDDRQITYSVTIQVGISAPVVAREGSRAILEAYHAGEPFLYIRVENAPDYLELPG